VVIAVSGGDAQLCILFKKSWLQDDVLGYNIRNNTTLEAILRRERS
jgi:hypothetical protein